MKRLRMKLKNQSKKPLKGKRRHKMYVPEGGGATSSKASEYTEKKSAETKIPKTEKKQESSSKTKSTEEKINSNARAPKMATRSDSRLKSVPERLKNYFTVQDEEYFSSQETDDVFVSGKSRKK